MKFISLLWHGERAVGICVFTCPPISLAGRRKYFGLQGRWSRLGMQALTRQVAMLSRVVLHPTYRGAGVAAAFVRKSCECCGLPWVEVLAEMGQIHPLFERAGFQRVGVAPRRKGSRRGHSALYGARREGYGKKKIISAESFRKSQYSQPVYYIFDNRRNVAGGKGAEHE
ncbi:MAG: hypothetical protein U0903_18190 [Planctomycetales bacterium]